MSGSSPYGIDYPLPGGGAAVHNASGLQLFRHAGALGSAALTTNLSRALLSSDYYAPFGFDESGAGAGYRSFTGQKQLSDSLHSGGQYDLPHREYNPIQGRWWTPDPAGLSAVNPNNPQTWNAYAYVAGTPLETTDPTGLVGEDLPGPGWTGAICNVDPEDPRCPLGGGGLLGIYIPPNLGGGWGGWSGAAPAPGGAAAAANPPASGAPAGATGERLFGIDALPPNRFWELEQRLLHAWWSINLAWLPWDIPGFGKGGGVLSIEYNVGYHVICWGVGPDSGTGHGVSYGPIFIYNANGTPATPAQAIIILSGPGWTGGANSPIGDIPAGPGAVAGGNNSGTYYGITVGVVGVSQGVTVSVCHGG